MLLYDSEKQVAVIETGKEILQKLLSDNPDLIVFDNDCCIKGNKNEFQTLCMGITRSSKS